MSKVPQHHAYAAHADKFQYNKNSSTCLFMQHIAWGLKNALAQIPKIAVHHLGDRTKYVGASAATGCLRKSYLDVKDIKAKEHSPEQMFVFERGHQLEEMIRKGANGMGWLEHSALEQYVPGAGIQYIHQLEAVGPGQWNFIRAHIDFVFIGSKELVIKEIKSSASIPTEPYESHRLQLTLQMWLVKQMYPDYNVRGSIVYHNWDSGESKDYEVELSKAFLKVALLRAKKLWYALENGVEPEAETQLYCGQCPFKGTCPKITEGIMQELPRDLIPIARRMKELSGIEKELKKLKRSLLGFFKSLDIRKTQIETTTFELVDRKGNYYLDSNRLKEEHLELYKSLLVEKDGYSYIKMT
jgi:CRISPR-associated exonuclease Cas4